MKGIVPRAALGISTGKPHRGWSKANWGPGLNLPLGILESYTKDRSLALYLSSLDVGSATEKCRKALVGHQSRAPPCQLALFSRTGQMTRNEQFTAQIRFAFSCLGGIRYFAGFIFSASSFC